MFREIRINRATQQSESGGALARTLPLAETASTTLFERIMERVRDGVGSPGAYMSSELRKKNLAFEQLKAEIVALDKSEKIELKAKLHLHALRIFAQMALDIMRIEPEIKIWMDEKTFEFKCKVGRVDASKCTKMYDRMEDPVDQIKAIRDFIRIMATGKKERESLHDMSGMLKIPGQIYSDLSVIL